MNKEPQPESASAVKSLPASLESSVGAAWAQQELQKVDFTDPRLSARALILLKDFFAKPMASIPEACGTVPKTKAAYEFFDNFSVAIPALWRSHLQATQQRLGDYPLILAVQDTTSLNHSSHPATEGTGPIGTDADKTKGWLVHSTLALTPEALPLGLLDVQVWARDPEEFGKKKSRRQRPIEEKESYKWVRSYQACQAAQAQWPETLIVNIGDRESDIYELFELALSSPPPPHLLIRAEQNRLVEDEARYLWDLLARQPVCTTLEAQVPRQGQQPKRVATLEVRFAEVRIKPPARLAGVRPAPTLKLWAVWAEEVGALAGVEPIAWMLVTTLPVLTTAQALEKLRWYALRWQIELFHKVLKSGCRAEQRQLKSDERLERCLFFDMLVAWRILLLTKLGREVPQLPASTVLEAEEWQALYCFTHQTTQLPDREPTLKEAMGMVAKLGGFLGRKGDKDPGSITLWRGLQRLYDIVAAYKLFRPAPS
jgi:hypothetical protein